MNVLLLPVLVPQSLPRPASPVSQLRALEAARRFAVPARGSYFAVLRLNFAAIPNKPRPRRARVDGSGTVV
jgi:hypothetical protein